MRTFDTLQECSILYRRKKALRYRHMQTAKTIGEVETLTPENIGMIVATAVLADDDAIKMAARKKIRAIARDRGIFPASIYPLYKGFGLGEVSGFTVPAMNIRTMNFDLARMVFQLSRELDTRSFIFEIAQSEMGYTQQDPDEFTVGILAGAIAEGYTGPVFLQGDHYQFKREVFDVNPEGEIAKIRNLVEQSVKAGFYNIDIDASTLVDLDKPLLRDQQKNNFEMTALLTEYIRSIEPKGITISLGGEIGHIGGKNSTVEEFETFMENYLEKIKEKTGIAKVSVQTGTHHGGIPLADGTIASVDIDFSVLRDITKKAREKYHVGGTVQHGASTLPNELFHHFPENNTLEIHLATGFQNILYDTMPKALRDILYAWIRENLQNEREEGMTEEQFLYKTRKKAFGPFKKEFWGITAEDKEPMLQAFKKQLAFLFEQLQITGKREIVDRYVKKEFYQ